MALSTVNDSELSADQKLAEALARRALALDETWGAGRSTTSSSPTRRDGRSVGGSIEQAREHLERDLVRISDGRGRSPT